MGIQISLPHIFQISSSELAMMMMIFIEAQPGSPSWQGGYDATQLAVETKIMVKTLHYRCFHHTYGAVGK